MIESLIIRNFRKFQSYSVRIRNGNILVGPNNSGKSSILDAFRLLSACYRQTRFNPRPMSINGEGVCYGYEVSDSLLPFSLSNITNNYSEEDAVLEFKNLNGKVAVLRLNPDRPTRFFLRSGEQAFRNASAFRKAFPLNIVLVPTLSPLESEERYVEDETVRKNSSTRLASRTLRNFWLRERDDEFEFFRNEVETAWDGIELQKPELRRTTPPIVEMYLKENRILREVQSAGFGFQVWLQIQTHLRRGDKNSLLVIDEPDVYLHPDLQRRLLHSIRKRFGQFVLATHSTEIINEAAGNEIVSINSKYKNAKRINTEEDYAQLLRYIGSSENADFARIVRAKRVIFLEGKDSRLLKRMAKAVGCLNFSLENAPPVIRLGGFAGSPKAAHAIWAFREILDLEISAICLLDKDFRPEQKNQKILSEIDHNELKTFILKRKEIENYLIDDEAIHHAIMRRLKSKPESAPTISIETVRGLLDEVMEEKKIYVHGQVISNNLQYARECGSKSDDSSIIAKTLTEFEADWASREKRIAIVPGKEVLSRFNEMLQTMYGISITEGSILDFMDGNSLGSELTAILREIDDFCAAT